MRLLAVGENLKKIYKTDNQIASKYPEIKWNDIIKFRDFISHHYELLDNEYVFDICKNELPILKAAIKKILVQ